MTLKITDVAQVGKQTDSEDRLVVDDSWSIALVSEETANDSDKTITVTAGEVWQILWIWVELVTTATVGDRQLEISFLDSTGDEIGRIVPQVTQAASLSRYYMFGPSLADPPAFRDTVYLMCPIPPTMILQPGDQIRIWDNNAVDAAADDLVIQMQAAQKDLPA